MYRFIGKIYVPIQTTSQNRTKWKWVMKSISCKMKSGLRLENRANTTWLDKNRRISAPQRPQIKTKHLLVSKRLNSPVSGINYRKKNAQHQFIMECIYHHAAVKPSSPLNLCGCWRFPVAGVFLRGRPSGISLLPAPEKKINLLLCIAVFFFLSFSVTISYFHNCNWFGLEKNIQPPAT